MTIALEEPTLPDHAVRVERLEDLNRIHDPHVNLVLLGRDPGPRFVADIEGSRWPDEFQMQVQSDDSEALSRHGWSRVLNFLKGPLREDLIDDILWLMGGFSKLTEKPFRVSVQVIHDVMCPAFHADSYGFRLITSYRGPGTEWVENDNVNWPNVTSRDYNQRILDAGAVRRVPTRHIALMQGDMESARVPGLVHRSPAHTRDAASRIVLRMDCW